MADFFIAMTPQKLGLSAVALAPSPVWVEQEPSRPPMGRDVTTVDTITVLEKEPITSNAWNKNLLMTFPLKQPQAYQESCGRLRKGITYLFVHEPVAQQ